MKIEWKNLKVAEFYKICRLCLANQELKPLVEEEECILIKLTPWIAQVDASVYFPNKICSDCAKQLQEANDFVNRCSTLTNSFHKCIEDYKERVSKDSRLPSLEKMLFTTTVTIKQEVEQTDGEIEQVSEEISPTMPFTEVFVPEEIMEFEDIKCTPLQTTSKSIESSGSELDNNETIESAPVIPEISKDKYKSAYNYFMDWRKEQNSTSFSESVLLSYFTEHLKEYKATTLWSQYSMLRATLKINNNVDISRYFKLKSFLKRKSDVHRPKKSKIFTSEEINKFIRESPDKEFLQAKIVLIMGIMGACGKDELYKMKITDLKDLGTEVIVKIPTTKAKVPSRMFTITGRFYEIFKKYADLRPDDTVDPSFFLNYLNGKCTVQKLGKNKMGNMGKRIASYLRLPNPELYTGHCFRRSSATILIDSGAGIPSVRRRRRLL